MTDDPAAVQTDDELFDALGAGHPPEGDRLGAVIDAWRAHINAKPIPDPPARPKGGRL